uniref:Uncharacterized protein n=1 Tax=Arundo donax TaxID=35708 RepID=A0A0A9DX82_ARUDO
MLQSCALVLLQATLNVLGLPLLLLACSIACGFVVSCYLIFNILTL